MAEMRGIMGMWKESGKFFPPGYPYEEERKMTLFLLGLGSALSLRFFGSLHNASESLYYVDRIRGRTVRPGALAESFLELAWGYAGMFLPLYLFLGGMMLYHYFYYYRDCRSIYLMRRLPERGELWKSCVRAPLLGMAAGAVVMAALFLLYYGSYRLLIPAECMPRLW
ncbi:hypothetical protein [Acetatifactor muris]|uniref:hypothetical protein n=1 Tax=Acetatifactor muris TaxID=879566 RepID=UPI0023F413DD|nr:hypothetical protein [Acetatifactor muris]